MTRVTENREKHAGKCLEVALSVLYNISIIHQILTFYYIMFIMQKTQGESVNAFINRAIDEAIRVTRPGGVLFFAFLSVYGIMYANYFHGNWALGEDENFTKDYKIRHFKEQLFTGYDVVGFEQLFAGKPVTWITTAGTDGILESIEDCPDFGISEEDFEAFAAWYLHFAEKRELLGNTNHLLYICRKIEYKS